jgi:hypothetical protein
MKPRRGESSTEIIRKRRSCSRRKRYEQKVSSQSVPWGLKDSTTVNGTSGSFLIAKHHFYKVIHIIEQA